MKNKLLLFTIVIQFILLPASRVFGQNPSLYWWLEQGHGNNNGYRDFSQYPLVQQINDLSYIYVSNRKFIRNSNPNDIRNVWSVSKYLDTGVDGFAFADDTRVGRTLGPGLATSIDLTQDNGFVLSGYSSNNWFEGFNESHGGFDYVICKYDENNFQWYKCIGGVNDDMANSIKQSSDGGYIIAGQTNSNDGDVSGNHGATDAWIVKLNSVGNIEWQKCFGGSSNDIAYSTQKTSDGGFIFVGQTNSNDGNIIGNHGENDAWVVKLNSNGNIEWQKCLGGTGNDIAKSIQSTLDGGFIVVGETNSINGDIVGNHGGSDAWIVKLNSVGNIEWQKCAGGTQNDSACSVQQSSDGKYLIAGQTFSNDGDVSGNHGGGDSWVFQVDFNQNLLWQICHGLFGDDYALEVKLTNDGGFILTTNFYGWNGDWDYNGKWYVYKFQQLSNANFEEYDKMLIYPNPVNDRFFVKLNQSFNLKGYILNIVNPLGQKVYSKSIEENQIQELSIDFKSISGMYFVQIIDPQGLVVEVKKILKQ
jgi:hypothetical protein